MLWVEKNSSFYNSIEFFTRNFIFFHIEESYNKYNVLNKKYEDYLKIC